ncbi:MAG: rod shape-determining protein RodA [Bacillota bacterium]
MKWKKRFWKNINIVIPITVILLILIGLVALSSAVEVNKDSINFSYLQRQIIALVIGIFLIIFIQFYDYKLIKDYSEIIYFATNIVLFLLLFLGSEKGGGVSWFRIGSLSFQPSEVAKITVIIMLANVMTNLEDELQYLSGIIKSGIYAFIPFLLIVLQNDLGTALVIIFIYIIMLYIAGGNKKFMLIIFGGSFLVIILLITFHLYFDTPLPYIKDYQLNRLLVFANPDIDPQGASYNILQSKIALGSGRLSGKGIFAGTQNQLNFLPEKHTDFIFSVIGEEFGFIGVSTVLILYFLLFWNIIKVAINARDKFGQLTIIGILAMLFFHVIQNTGMTMGIMPITGIPLPFISYGGSAILNNMIAIGIIINVNVRKKKIMF